MVITRSHKCSIECLCCITAHRSRLVQQELSLSSLCKTPSHRLSITKWIVLITMTHDNPKICTGEFSRIAFSASRRHFICIASTMHWRIIVHQLMKIVTQSSRIIGEKIVNNATHEFYVYYEEKKERCGKNKKSLETNIEWKVSAN